MRKDVPGRWLREQTPWGSKEPDCSVGDWVPCTLRAGHGERWAEARLSSRHNSPCLAVPLTPKARLAVSGSPLKLSSGVF